MKAYSCGCVHSPGHCLQLFLLTSAVLLPLFSVGYTWFQYEDRKRKLNKLREAYRKGLEDLSLLHQDVLSMEGTSTDLITLSN